nr:Spermidine/putrescine import ATP-binding protein PotA [Klebsiella pneumoniae]
MGIAPEQRDIGMVFQDYALWPHMSVAQNVAFPLRMRGVSRSERERRVSEALARVGLNGFAERKPSGLSGGQQQRVSWRGRSSPRRGCCCLMNRSPTGQRTTRIAVWRNEPPAATARHHRPVCHP